MYLTEDGRPQPQVGWKESKMSPVSDRIVGVMIALSGGLIILIATLAGIDVLFFAGQLHLATWGGEQRMAIPTAACFTLLGSALILTASLRKSVAEKRR